MIAAGTVYWYAPATPAPVARVQATGWDSPLAAHAYSQPGDSLWMARAGAPKTARKLSAYRAEQLLAELAAWALARAPAESCRGIDAAQTLRNCTRVAAARDCRYVPPEQADKVAGLARVALRASYATQFRKLVEQEFERLAPSRTAKLGRSLRLLLTTTQQQTGATRL
jgi:hypothetical protein